MTDTGFLCRRLLGWDYDLAEFVDEQSGAVGSGRVNEGTGGVRATGPHSEMTKFVDAGGSNLLLLAPRGSYKSTIGQGRAVRQLLAHPDSRVLYGMDTYERCKQKLIGIKTIFESNDKLLQCWGDMRGDKWTDERFNLKGVPAGRQEFSLQGFAIDRPATGGHYELIILDDVCNHVNTRTKDGIERIMTTFKQVSPLLVNGGVLLIMGTLYADNDLYNYIMREMPNLFKVLRIEAGMDIHWTQEGTMELVGDPVFAHLDKVRLGRELERMGYTEFAAQYLNRIVTGVHEPFRRAQFLPLPWNERQMNTYTGYVLTDTATSQKDEGCYSVVAYGLFDKAENFYLADLRVGHFTVPQYVEQFLDVLQTWGNRVYHRGELWERTVANDVFRASVDEEARRRGIRPMTIMVTRGANEHSKEQRIRALETRFAHNRFYVLDSVPRTFVDLQKIKLLWDPEGYRDEDDNILPGGELVEEFIRFPRYPKQDIPDAIADIDRSRLDGGRYCCYCTPSYFKRRKAQESLRWQVGQPVDLGVLKSGKKLPRRRQNQSGWIEKLSSRF